MINIKLKKKYRIYSDKPKARKATDNGRNSPHKKGSGILKGNFGVGHKQAPREDFLAKNTWNPMTDGTRIVDGATGRMRKA